TLSGMQSAGACEYNQKPQQHVPTILKHDPASLYRYWNFLSAPTNVGGFGRVPTTPAPPNSATNTSSPLNSKAASSPPVPPLPSDAAASPSRTPSEWPTARPNLQPARHPAAAAQTSG